MKKKPHPEFYPFYEVGFDFSTSLSIDDAVLAMLGIVKKPLFEVTEAMLMAQQEAHEQGIDESEFTPSLLDILRDVKEEVDAVYMDARSEKAGQEVLDEKLVDIQKVHELIKTGHLFKCHIHDELAKGARSLLRLDITSTMDNPRITLKSLSRWSVKIYHLEILPQRELVTFCDLALDVDQFTHSIRNGLDADEVKKLRISFALLVEALANADSGFKNKNSPNVSKIAKHIEKISSDCSEELKRSESTVKKEIEEAFQVKNGQKKSDRQSKTKAKTLYIIFAFVYVELVKIRFPNNPESEEHIQAIAAELATSNAGLAGQERKAIERRIEQALEVKRNPDKREE